MPSQSASSLQWHPVKRAQQLSPDRRNLCSVKSSNPEKCNLNLSSDEEDCYVSDSETEDTLSLGNIDLSQTKDPFEDDSLNTEVMFLEEDGCGSLLGFQAAAPSPPPGCTSHKVCLGSTAVTEVARGTSTPTNKSTCGLQHAQFIYLGDQNSLLAESPVRGQSSKVASAALVNKDLIEPKQLPKINQSGEPDLDLIPLIAHSAPVPTLPVPFESGFKQSELLFGCTTFFSRMAGKLKSLKYGGYKKQITKTMRNLIRLYSSFPLEVVSVLLQFLLKSSDCSEGNEVDSYKSQVENDLGSLKPIQGTVNVWKLVIAKLSHKEPKFLLTMIKAVLEMIEAQETPSSGTGDHPLSLSLNNHQIEFLSSLVLWLIERLKELKNLRCRQSENGIPSEEADVIPIATLVELIRKCLLIVAPGNSLLTDSALILAEMIGNNSLVEQLKKLPLLRLPDFDFTDENSSSLDPENFLLQQEEFIVQAAAKLKLLKIQQKKSKMVNSTPINSGMEKKTNTWTLVKSWNPCPIGMLPHALSSSGVLPVLDGTNHHKVQDSLVGSFEEKENCELNRSIGKRDASCGVESLENTNAMKKMKQSVDDVGLDGQSDLSSGGITGRLLIDGFWKKVGEEELQAIGSAIRILV